MTTAPAVLRNLDLVEPFVRSATEVFQTMLSCPCRPGAIRPIADGHRKFGVTSLIGLSGHFQGAISLSVPTPAAFEILNRMTGMDAFEVDDFVRDAVGEVINMIGGMGKKELCQYEFLLGLPQVIVGGDYQIFSPRWASHHWLPIESEIGVFHLDVGFDTSRRS